MDYYSPKYFSKKAIIDKMTAFFFSCLLPPPKHDMTGRILSMISFCQVLRFGDNNDGKNCRFV